MSMSKKDYVALATALKEANTPDNRAAVSRVVNNLLPHLRLNVAFDDARFVASCGLAFDRPVTHVPTRGRQHDLFTAGA